MRRQIDVNVRAEFAGDPLHDLRCSGHAARHGQVARKNAAQRRNSLSETQ